MTMIGPLLRAKLSDESQVLEGFRAEPWDICDRVPEAVVMPETEEEICEVLRLCTAHGWNCVPCGKGTWLYGGQPPHRIDVVMSLTRMDRVTEYEPGDLTVTAEAGIGFDLLAKRTFPHGQWLPLDPPGLPRGTLGAVMATASTGSLEAGFGQFRDHVLGATLIRPDGTRLELGGKVVKNVAGFDLLRLATGSWGTLGVISSVTTRLHPRPALDRAILFASAGDSPLVELAMALAELPGPIASLDVLVPGDAEQAGPGATPLVMVRLADSVATVEEVTRSILELAPDPPQPYLEDLDAARIFQNVQAVEEGAELVLRIKALPSELGTSIEAAEHVRPLVDPNRGFGLRIAAHARTGVVRVIVSRLLRGDGWMEGVEEVVARLRAGVELRGGTLRVTQGPPELVKRVGSWGSAGPEAGLIEGLKDAFDPHGILSPGRLGVV